MSGFAQEEISISGGGGGDASAAKQDLQTALLTTIDSDTGNIATSVGSVDSKLTTLNAKDFATETTLLALNAKIPALGQALAVASVPVILPSATITTLTPPAAITGFALESTLSTLNGKITACNTGAVIVSSSALPTGASTSALQTSGNSSLTSIDGKIVAVNTGAVIISSSALPSGASTSANQTTLNAKFAGAPTLFRNAGANATLNVKSSAGVLVSFSCYNTNNSSRFIQIWNSATTAGSGTLMISKLIPAGSEIVIGTDYLSAAGLACSSGIAFGFSTTKDTYTAGTAGEQSTEVLYI